MGCTLATVRAGLHRIEHCVGPIGGVHTRERQKVFSVLFLDDIDDIVDGQHPDQPAGRVGHGR